MNILKIKLYIEDVIFRVMLLVCSLLFLSFVITARLIIGFKNMILKGCNEQ